MPTSKKAANVEVRAVVAPVAPAVQDETSVVATGDQTSVVRGREAQAQVQVRVPANPKARAVVVVAAGFHEVMIVVDVGAASAGVVPATAEGAVLTDPGASRSRTCPRGLRST